VSVFIQYLESFQLQFLYRIFSFISVQFHAVSVV